MGERERGQDPGVRSVKRSMLLGGLSITNVKCANDERSHGFRSIPEFSSVRASAQ